MIELMMVMAILSVLLTLGAFAIRHFWLVRSLSGGQDEIVSQLRAVQSKVMAESNPLVYGIGFREGTDEWEIVRYNSVANSCVGDGTRNFDAGVIISDADFATTLSGQSTSGMVTACQSAITAPAAGFVFFLPRGTASSGTVTIRQPNLDRTRSVQVDALSGRVYEP